MICDILYESSPWHARAALFAPDGRLLTLNVDDCDDPYRESAIVQGRIRKVVEGLQAAFVDIGDTVDGFLPFSKVPKDLPKLTEGQLMPVRITRGRSGEKGARLDARTAVNGEKHRNDKPGHLIVSAPDALSRALVDAGSTPVRVWIHQLPADDHVKKRVAEERIFALSDHPEADFLELFEVQLEGLVLPLFTIPGGGHLVIERTHALTSIDVDSGGGYEHRKKDNDALNRRAADEIVRLTRLLDLGGSILVDFLTPKNKEEREKLVTHLHERFGELDPRNVEVAGVSRFGIAEINREAYEEPLLTRLTRPVYVAGDILLKLAWQKPGAAPLAVEAPQEVAEILKRRLSGQADMAWLGRPVKIVTGNDTGRIQIYRE